MSDKVYCTADGDYPNPQQMVIFEEDGEIYIGGYLVDKDLWFTDDEYDNEPINYSVYWKPLKSLKEQYEKQKEE